MLNFCRIQLAEAILLEHEFTDDTESIHLMDRRTFRDGEGQILEGEAEERQHFLVGQDDEGNDQDDNQRVSLSSMEEGSDQETLRGSLLQHQIARVSHIDIQELNTDDVSEEPFEHSKRRGGLSAKAGVILVSLLKRGNSVQTPDAFLITREYTMCSS